MIKGLFYLFFPVPKPVAFEIPIDPVVVNDGDGDSASSACKKEPPKRLARLEEHRPSIPTAQELEEKLQKAEERRQEIIEERINKSKAFQQKFSEKVIAKNCL